MKKWLYRRKESHSFSAFLPVSCSVLLLIFAVFYFSAYAKPYMQKNIIDISDGWQYRTIAQMQFESMSVLRHVEVPVGETLILSRTLKEDIPDASLMFKSNHQRIKVLLDGKLLFESPYDPEVKNPGMGLHLVLLPKNYIGKLLQMELVSPYAAYSGAPSSVYLGDIPSLETYAASRSMLHTLLMVICLAVGAFIMVLAVLRRKHDGMDWGNFFFGVYSVLWGFYFPSGDFIAHQFFSPQLVSYISIGLYFLYPLPLVLYFYCQFTRCRKVFLPVVVLRGAFVAAAFGLQLSGAVDFPDMLDINNPLYVLSSVYLIVLGFVEMKKGNRFIRFTIPWMLLAFVVSMQSMISFYTTRIKQDETLYEMAFFMLIMTVWVYNVMEFYRARVQERSEKQVLHLKNQLVLQSYENTTKHLEQVSLLRHEMKNHIAAMQILMDGREYEKARSYLSKLTQQQEQIQQVRYCEHYLVNAILSTRLAKLKEAGVRVAHSIAVPKELEIPDEDLSSLLMNILDNATEALAEMQISDKWMELKIHMQKPYLYISCKNRKENLVLDSGGSYLSTKRDQERHGYGLKIIRQIAEKNDGLLNISHTAHTFNVEVALKERSD